MTQETEKRFSATSSRRRFLQLSFATAAGVGLWLTESKLNSIRSLLAEEYTIGVPGVVSSGEPERPTPSPEMLNLQERLRTEIEAHEGQTAIAVTDIKTGETVDVNGDRLQLTGCVANLACALAVIKHISEGKIRREEVESGMTTMVRYSSPFYAGPLVEKLGGGNMEKGVRVINELMDLWGMKESDYDHPPAYYSPSLWGKPNKFAANEVNLVLEKLAKNQLFEPTMGVNWNFYAIVVMCKNKVGLNFMIHGEIPESEAIVAHKVGWYPGWPHTINDVGLVFARDGGYSFAISCFYQNYDYGMDEQSLFYGPGFFLRHLADLSHQTFQRRYGQARSFWLPQTEAPKLAASNLKYPYQI